MSHELISPQQSEATQTCESGEPGETGQLSLNAGAARQIRRFETLQHIAQRINRAAHVQSALPAVTRIIVEELHVHSVSFGIAGRGWIAHWGPESEDLVVTDLNQATLGPLESFPAFASRNRETPQEPEAPIEVESAELGRAVCLPILVDGARAGVVLVATHDQERVEADLVWVVKHVAKLLGAGLEREEELLARTPASAPTNTAQLLEILSRLATFSNINVTIQPILAEIADLVGARIASLLITDDANLECFSSSPAATDAIQENLLYLVTSPLVRRAIGTFQAQSGPLGQRYGSLGCDSAAMAVPLVINGETGGVLVLERAQDVPFSTNDRDTAITLTQHLAFSLERERRMKSYSRQNLLLSLVERVTATVARSAAAEDIFVPMAREIRRTFGYDCSIAMIEGNRLVFRALEVVNPELLPDWVEDGMPLSVGVIGKVARTGQPMFIPDVFDEPAFLDTGRGSRSEIAVPINVGDEVVGVINIESSSANPLEQLDFEIMLILANHIGIALNNRQLIASERDSRMAIEAIQRVSTIVAETLDPDESLRRIAETLGETLGYPIVSLAILEGTELVLKASYGYDPDKMPVSININDGISGRVARTGQPVFVADISADPDYVQVHGEFASEVCVPIRCNGEIVGILNVEGTLERPVTERDLHLLTTFAEHAGVLLNNARAYAALSREATLDAMTGVPNLRFFQQQLQIELERARRDGSPLSLAVIDMDYLKEINDSFGHLAGDQVLRELARRMSAQLRGVDMLARYAGDEFVTILPGVDEEQAREIAERLRDAARSAHFILPDAPPIQLSISIGVATYPHDATSSTDLLRAADMAMYVAKESGKNRVSTARQSEQVRRGSER